MTAQHEYSREDILSRNPLESVVARYGVDLKPHGAHLRGLCPLHKEKTPSFYIHLEKQVFKCQGCGAGGSVIDFVMKADGVTIGEAMKKLSPVSVGGNSAKAVSRPLPEQQKPIQATEQPKEKPVIEKIYEYQDADGKMVYEAIRLKPKSFRQRRKDAEGKWAWNMDGVTRVLFHLPSVLKSQWVWIVEGEKDAETLSEFFTATCNVGGAGKWLDGYTESLKGKDIVICGDNDKPGEDHVQMILKALAGNVKSVRVVKVPAPHKDVTDYMQTLPDSDAKQVALAKMFEAAQPLRNGLDLPIKSIEELEHLYRQSIAQSATGCLDLGYWLPSLGLNVRKLIPGELVTIIADTGVGKTMILQNIAINCPIQTVLFEQELPGELTFERFVAIACKSAAQDVYSSYDAGRSVDWRSTNRLNHIFVCSEAALTPERLEELIIKSELVIGQKPKLILVDYIGLMNGAGKSRYERMSDVAEKIKSIAKRTGVIIIIASQRNRPQDDSPEVFLHDAKDSGSIENSSGLVLGVWRNPDDANIMHVKVLKNTKGKPGLVVLCDINGETLTIREKSKID